MYFLSHKVVKSWTRHYNPPKGNGEYFANNKGNMFRKLFTWGTIMLSQRLFDVRIYPLRTTNISLTTIQFFFI